MVSLPPVGPTAWSVKYKENSAVECTIEYKVMASGNLKDLNTALNTYASEGWRYLDMYSDPGHRVNIILFREKDATASIKVPSDPNSESTTG